MNLKPRFLIKSGYYIVPSASTALILGVPKCLKHKLVMELFINDYLQRVCNLDFNYLPNWQTERCFNIMQKQGKDINKIVIIVHGFMASLKASWVHEMKNTIQDMEENTAVMVRLHTALGAFTYDIR